MCRAQEAYKLLGRAIITHNLWKFQLVTMLCQLPTKDFFIRTYIHGDLLRKFASILAINLHEILYTTMISTIISRAVVRQYFKNNG